jgi:hypothetical protein
MAQKLDSATLRRLAVKASCSPPTIQKVYLGRPVRGLAYYRARAALEEAGLSPRAIRGSPKQKLTLVPHPPKGERDP